MGTTTLNQGDIGRLSASTAAITGSDIIVIKRAATGHLRRATVDQITAGFTSIITSSNVTVGGAVTSQSEVVTNFEKITSTAVSAVAVNGMTVLASTATNATLVLPAPVVGGFKWIRAATSFAQTVTCSGANIGSSYTAIAFASNDQAVILRGEGTTQWGVYAMVGGLKGTSSVATIS